MQLDPNRDFNPYAPPVAATDVYGRTPDADDLVLAGRDTRFFAQLTDGVLMMGAFVSMQLAGLKGVAVTVGFLSWLALLLYQGYLVSTTGQSLGKRWLGIRIVRRDGAPVDFVSGVLIRSWAMYVLCAIPFLGGFIGLTDALMIFGQERECLHDKLAGTRVIVVMPARH